MQKNVLVKVKGTQFQEDTSEVTELITTGSCYEKNGKTYILYEEVSDESMKTTKNTIKLYDNKAELIRRGESSVNIIFENGRKWDSYYVTPVGSLKMTFHTKSISIEMDAEGSISVIIKYEILADYSTIADYLMEITVTEAVKEVSDN